MSAQTQEEWRRKKESLMERGIEYCLASYVDIHGIPKAKSVPLEHFETTMGGSELFTGAALEGLGQRPNYEINLYELPDKELHERGIRLLPRTLLEAVEAFERDELAREVFGPDLHHAFCELKYAEWWGYHNRVSDWERDHYLTKF